MQNRKVIVEFVTASGAKQLDGIDIKFDITKPMSAVMNEGKIDICNLAREDIEYLTTFTSQYIAINQRKRIRVFAGYEATGVSLIFDGDIVEAKPTSPPDIWLNCKAMSGYYDNKSPISKSINRNISVKELAEQAADWTGLQLYFESTASKILDGFNFTGDKTKIIKELNALGGIVAFEEDGVLNILDEGKPKSTAGVRYLSEDSGLIGIPKVDTIGAEMTLLLDNSLKNGQTVVLNSKRMPSANGTYYIYENRYSGHLRGNNFYSQIRTRRI